MVFFLGLMTVGRLKKVKKVCIAGLTYLLWDPTLAAYIRSWRKLGCHMKYVLF